MRGESQQHHLIVLCIFLLLTCSGCPSGWTSFEKTCYKAFYWTESYQGALDTCKAYGSKATLVTPVDKGVNQFLSTLR